MKKLLSAFFIYLISFQLCFAETIARFPANNAHGHELSLDELKQQLADFKVKVSGREELADCQQNPLITPAELMQTGTSIDQENQRTDYFLARLEVNACSQALYSYEEEVAQTSACEPVKTLGIIDRLVEDTMMAEQEGSEPQLLRLDDPEIRSLHREAEYLYGEVRKYLYNNTVERAERQELLVQYLDSILMSMRDLIVVKRSYISEREYDGRFFYQNLIPEFPSDMIRDEDTVMVEGFPQRVIDRINMGPNPSTSPFHLNIVQKNWGRSTVEFRELDIFSRDLMSLLRAPTSHNYIRALKWMTLQMMLSQLQVYKAVTGDTSKTQLPLSCQNHRNGDLPAQLELTINPETGEQFVETMMMSHGLLFDNTDYQALEYFVENIDRDPLRDGYSGVLGFETYQSAKVGLAGRDSASLDDIANFDSVFQMKFYESLEPYKGSVRPPRTQGAGRRGEARRINYAGIDEFNKIVSQPSEFQVFSVETSGGRQFTLDPQRQNLSTYLAEAMVRSGALYFEELISPDLKAQLEARAIAHDFPSLYGSHLWRLWGLKTLSEGLDNAQKSADQTSVKRLVTQFCHTLPLDHVARVCGNERDQQLASVSHFLAEFREADEYLPLRRLDESQLKDVYPSLGVLWMLLRDQTSFLNEAKTNEYDFLIDQMYAYNPWARMRLGYLIHRDELARARNGHTPLYTQNRRNRTTLAEQSECLYTRIDARIQKLDEAARPLGLERPLSIVHVDRLLSHREKSYIWETLVDEVHEGNSQLFTEQINGKEAYDYLDNISYKTLLTKESLNEFVSTQMPSLDAKARAELDAVLSDEQSQAGALLFNIYQMRGQPERQFEAFQQLVSEHGVRDSFRAKVSFLLLDSEIKKPLMKQVIRLAAEQRKTKINEALDSFCQLQPDDYDTLKTLFYSTSKAQNKINQLAGLPGVPGQVMDKINEMSPDEWANLWLGLGAGILGIGAILIGGACAAVTGGLCAPLSAAMIAAGASAISMQLMLVGREYQMKQNADRLETQVLALEELGFAGRESAAQVSRSWFWTAFEAVFVIPLIGLSARAVQVGGKMFYVSTSHTLKGTSREAFREVARGTLAEADVRMARYKLGMDHLGNQLTVQSLARAGSAGAEASAEISALLIRQGVPAAAVREAFQDIDKLKALFASGRMSMDTLMRQMTRILEPLQIALRGSSSVLQRSFGSVVVNESKQIIDRRAAEVIASYFGHNPNGLLNLVKTYTGRRMATAQARMALVTNGTGALNRVPLVRNLTNWFRKIRSEELVKNADKLRLLETELTTIVRNGGDLQQFVLRHMDDLTDVFLNIPLRKRELPYFLMVLGGPTMGGRLAGSKIPVVGTLTDGFMMRQLFNARARLVYESFKNEARQILALPRHVAAEGGLTAYKAFQYSSAQAISQMTQEEARLFTRQIQELETQIGTRLHQHLTRSGSAGKKIQFADGRAVNGLNQAELQRILFNPANLEEKAVAEVVWVSLPHEEIFGLAHLGTVAHKAVEHLARYQTADQFQDFLNAMKVLMIQKNPAVVQYF